MRGQDNTGIDRGLRLATRIATCAAFSLLLAVVMLAAPAAPSAEVAIGISVAFAPPALPIYIQPPCPGPGYIWTPGYWAWDPDFGYYWVPGTWVLAPFIGALWTPGYWGWSDGVYVWYAGYWGPVIGFYGGINYGFGYTGYGYDGGYWRGGSFYYNRTVNNVSVTNITNVYSKTVVGPVTRTRVSFNGGQGGTSLRPTATQLAAAREKRSVSTEAQMRNERVARGDPGQRASVNRGRPTVAATPRPGEFTGRNIVPATRAGAPYKAPPGRMERPGATERRPRAGAPEREAPPGRMERPGATERRPRGGAPEREAPPSRMERPVAPRGEPGRPSFRPNEPRPAPERPGVVRPPSVPRAAPERPEAPREPKENPRREEGGPR